MVDFTIQRIDQSESMVYTPLPGEEDFFSLLWGGGDRDAYLAFCAKVMWGDGDIVAPVGANA